MLTESLALSKRRLLNDGCHSTLLGKEAATASIAVCFAGEQRRLGICKSRYRKAVLAGRIQENWLVPAAEKVGIGRIGWHTFRHYAGLLTMPGERRTERRFAHN
jgi:hypothetical protein